MIQNLINIKYFIFFIFLSCFLFIISLFIDNINYSISFLIVSFSILCFSPIFFDKGMPVVSNPINWCLFLYFIYYGSGTYLSFTNTEINNIEIPSIFLKIQLIYIYLCTLCFIFGYYLMNFKVSFQFVLEKKQRISFITIVFILFFISKFYFFSSGRYFHAIENESTDSESINIFEQFFYFFSFFNIFFIIQFGYNWLIKKENKYKVYFFLTILVSVLLEMLSGSKERFLAPVFISVIVFSIFVNKSPIIPLISFLIFSLLFVFPFFELYRLGSRLGYKESFINTIQNFDFLTLSESLDGIKSIGSNRLNAAAIQAKIIYEHSINEKPFLFGSDYYNMISSIIPRFIWNNKPIMNNANLFGIDYGIIPSYDVSTSVAQYWQGEAFINLGWFGCLIGFFVGLTLKFVKIIFYNKSNEINLFFFIVLSYNILRMDHFSFALLGMIKFFFITIICFLPFLKIKKVYTLSG